MKKQERNEKYVRVIEALKAIEETYINAKGFEELTGTKPNGTIAHETVVYVLPDELCDYRGYEHGTQGVRYLYEVKDCIRYFEEKIA